MMDPVTDRTVYISAGNSDDRLTQGEWASFVTGIRAILTVNCERIYGYWLSPPDSPWQNMCIAVQVPDEGAETLKAALTELRVKYRQDSLAWAEAVTEFI